MERDNSILISFNANKNTYGGGVRKTMPLDKLKLNVYDIINERVNTNTLPMLRYASSSESLESRLSTFRGINIYKRGKGEIQMAKEPRHKNHTEDDISNLSPGEIKTITAKDRDFAVWVREDGAVCVGNQCIVIKREPGGKNLDVEIKPTQCGEAAADALLDTLLKTVGKGGNTRFTVKSDLQLEGDKPK